jgi:hypothetical protein
MLSIVERNLRTARTRVFDLASSMAMTFQQIQAIQFAESEGRFTGLKPEPITLADKRAMRLVDHAAE